MHIYTEMYHFVVNENTVIGSPADLYILLIGSAALPCSLRKQCPLARTSHDYSWFAFSGYGAWVSNSPGFIIERLFFNNKKTETLVIAFSAARLSRVKRYRDLRVLRPAITRGLPFRDILFIQ